MPAILKYAAAITLTFPLLCQAGLTGTSVSGSLYFVGPKNYFDPVNGPEHIPTGAGNTNSPTVTIADPLVEFGYFDEVSRITADFTNLRVTISETAYQTNNSTIVKLGFFDDAFVGRVAVPVSNTYSANPAVSLVYDSLNITFPDQYAITNGTTTAFTLALTLPGDADLNGTVDFNDFLVLQNNFNQPNTGFAQGDFNADGQTDFNDFLVLQNNFGQSVAGAPFVATAAEVKVMTAFVNAVPEPAAMSVLGLAVVLLRRRR